MKTDVGPRLLMSFAHWRDVDLDRLFDAQPIRPLEVFADSGAFTAETLGWTVTLPEYVAWLRRYPGLFSTIANLDVIGDPKATMRNQLAMEDAGIEALPVFHVGSPWRALDELIRRGYRYIAIGNMVGRTKDRAALLRWCVEAFRRGRAEGVLFHSFGRTTRDLVHALGWYSLDSSTWSAGHRWGTLFLWDDEAGWVRRVRISTTEPLRHAELIRDHGGDPSMFAKPMACNPEKRPDADVALAERSMLIDVNQVAWRRLQGWMRRHHGTVGGDGPKVFLVEVSEVYFPFHFGGDHNEGNSDRVWRHGFRDPRVSPGRRR